MQVTQTNSTQSTTESSHQTTASAQQPGQDMKYHQRFGQKLKFCIQSQNMIMFCFFFLRKSKHQKKLKDNKGVVKEGKLKCLLLMVYVIIHHDQTCSIV